MVGIAGMPGSGKTTLAGRLAGALERKAGRPLSAAVPMDGFHFTRAELDGMPDPALAHARRGAPWTFDAESYVAALARLKTGGLRRQACPSFDHGVGDPVPGDIPVLPTHRIVVTEGNYLLLGAAGGEQGTHFVALWGAILNVDRRAWLAVPLSAVTTQGPSQPARPRVVLPARSSGRLARGCPPPPPWRAADEEPWVGLEGVLDTTLFVDCDVDEAMFRVEARQVANGATAEAAAGRVAANDRPNALQVAATRGRARLVVPSLPYRPTWPQPAAEE